MLQHPNTHKHRLLRTTSDLCKELTKNFPKYSPSFGAESFTHQVVFAIFFLSGQLMLLKYKWILNIKQKRKLKHVTQTFYKNGLPKHLLQKWSYKWVLQNTSLLVFINNIFISCNNSYTFSLFLNNSKRQV